jgi:hypothetical protein
LKTIAQGRAVLERGAADAGVWLPAATLDLVQGVALLETHQGDGWSGAGVKSHNWGAIHAAEIPPCKPGHFAQDDDGPACFQTYPSDRAGAAALVRVLWKMPHVRGYLASGGIDAGAMASAMQADRYYTAPLEPYQGKLRAAVTRVRDELGRAEVAPFIGAGVAFVVGWAAIVGVVVYRAR